MPVAHSHPLPVDPPSSPVIHAETTPYPWLPDDKRGELHVSQTMRKHPQPPTVPLHNQNSPESLHLRRLHTFPAPTFLLHRAKCCKWKCPWSSASFPAE